MRRRRLIALIILIISTLAGVFYEAEQQEIEQPGPISSATVQEVKSAQSTIALAALEEIPVKGRAPKTGYDREKFSDGWGEVNNCSMREQILLRDLTSTRLDEDGCRILSGTLNDPYTAKTILFIRGAVSSQAVQIDHVVAVSDAWQKGAQQLTPELRYQFYNDPLNLLAVDGEVNNQKGDGDAATWLPPNKDYRCRYVARQISVKIKYSLWMTKAEHETVKNILKSCPEQVLPLVS
jgi:hypothetical protein